MVSHADHLDSTTVKTTLILRDFSFDHKSKEELTVQQRENRQHLGAER